MPLRLAREDAEVLIINIEKNGGDASGLRQALDAVSKRNRQAGRAEDLSDEDTIQELRELSPITKGPGLVCMICGDPADELISGVCNQCFTKWALSVKKK